MRFAFFFIWDHNLIELYPPTGIPPVILKVAYAAVNTVLTKNNKPPIERDSIRRAILFLKKRNAK